VNIYWKTLLRKTVVCVLALLAWTTAVTTPVTGAEKEIFIPFDKGKTMKHSRPGIPFERYWREQSGVKYCASDWEQIWFKLPENFERGKRYLGVKCIQQDQWKNNLAPNWIYHNGELLHIDKFTTPEEIAGTALWTATGFHLKPLELKPGDIIGMRLISMPWMGLVFSRETPQLGVLSCAQTFAWRRSTSELWPALDVELKDVLPGKAVVKERKANIPIAIYNYSPKHHKLTVNWELTDFYGKTLDEGSIPLSIPSLSKENRSVAVSLPSDLNHLQFHVSFLDPDGQKEQRRADIVIDNSAGPRPRKNLDGVWAKADDDAIFLVKPPAAEKFTGKFSIPGLNLIWDKDKLQHIAWLRREISLPEKKTDERHILHLANVRYECSVFVNGRKAGDHFGNLDEFEFDVTDHFKQGDNEIIIGVRDWIAGVDPDSLRQADRKQVWQVGTFEKFIAPVVAPYVGGSKAGVSGSVYLETRPSLFISDVFVKPSVRENQLEIDVTVRNNTKSTATLKPEAAILDAGKEIVRTDGAAVTMKSGDEKTVTLKCDASKLPKWWPHDPHLLQCRIKLDGSKDAVSVRFGFREVWFEKSNLLFNGKPLHAYRCGSGGRMPNRQHARHRNRERRDDLGARVYIGETLHSKPALADVADEDGFLWDLETNDWLVYPTTHKLLSDVFWKNSANIAANVARTYRNHPCVIHYDHANEFACYSPYTNLNPYGCVFG